MQNTAQKGQDHPPGVQALPSRDRSLPTTAATGLTALPEISRRPTFPLPTPQAHRSPQSAESFLPGVTSIQFSDSGPITTLRPPAPTPITALEYIRLQIVNSAMEMRASRGNTMSVVTRPDTHTEIVLQLTMQSGLVDVEARLQRGDAGNLANQWSQLQQSLSRQGICLNALPSPESTSPDLADQFNQSDFKKEQPSPHEQEESSGTSTTLKNILSSPASAPTTTLSSADRSFESWA